MAEPVLKEEKKSVLELFGDFYMQMRGAELQEDQKELMRDIMRTVGGDRE